MADFADSCVRPDMDENITRLPILPEKPADVASPYAISSSISEAANNDDEEFKTVHQSHGEVLEMPRKLISGGNRSGENANIEQEVSRYQTCNRVTALQGDKNDAECARNNNSGNKYEVYSNLDYEQPWYSVNEITILNSCNGIVSLLNKESGNVALWNPAIKQLRPLPKSSSARCVKFGFGFDAKSNDYKFVKILYCYENKHSNLVEVYNLRTDSWRIIHKDGVLPFQYIDCNATICKNGTCFWIGYAHHDKFSPILISLDLNNEVFETMPLPGERDPDQPYCSRAYNALDLLNDKLCYIKGVNLSPFDMGHTYFEIWILDEYGFKESWKNICKFGPTGPKWDPPYVLGFSKNGESLLLGSRYLGCGYEYGEVYLSNFDAREDKYLELQNPKPLPLKFVSYNKLQNPNPVVLEFVRYNESLVSLKREDGAYK